MHNRTYNLSELAVLRKLQETMPLTPEALAEIRSSLHALHADAEYRIRTIENLDEAFFPNNRTF